MENRSSIPLPHFAPEDFFAKLSPDNNVMLLKGEDVLHSKYRFLLAYGCKEVKFSLDISLHKGQWWFGHINYDAHQEWSRLVSSHQPQQGFPSVYFFRPKFVIFARDELCFLECEPNDREEALNWFSSTMAQEVVVPQQKPFSLRATDTKEHYVETVAKLKKHLQRGDIYEINYCRFFEGEADLGLSNFLHWNKITDAPFSGYYRVNDNQLFCASPERFLCKRENTLIAQPIKGTAARHSDTKRDEQAKHELYHSEKERAENVMIVDLMRNDLSRIALKNSVKVSELFGIYSFPQVHQMISTVLAELPENCTLQSIFSHTFPMGSMTGAPKRRAMELIDAYETRSRELFSGSIGYVDPQGDFDFNVVIRSLMHHIPTKKINAGVGSAITLLADAEAEYEEIDWKLSTILSMQKI